MKIYFFIVIEYVFPGPASELDHSYFLPTHCLSLLDSLSPQTRLSDDNPLDSFRVNHSVFLAVSKYFCLSAIFNAVRPTPDCDAAYVAKPNKVHRVRVLFKSFRNSYAV